MRPERWWDNPSSWLYVIRASMIDGVTVLCGRETQEGWEYAVAQFNFRQAAPLARITNGVVEYFYEPYVDKDAIATHLTGGKS